MSAVTGSGIGHLRRRIIEAVAPEEGIPGEPGFITTLRHEQLLRECSEALAQARRDAAVGIPHEMLLLDLYAALGTLDAITARFGSAAITTGDISKKGE